MVGLQATLTCLSRRLGAAPLESLLEASWASCSACFPSFVVSLHCLKIRRLSLDVTGSASPAFFYTLEEGPCKFAKHEVDGMIWISERTFWDGIHLNATQRLGQCFILWSTWHTFSQHALGTEVNTKGSRKSNVFKYPGCPSNTLLSPCK